MHLFAAAVKEIALMREPAISPSGARRAEHRHSCSAPSGVTLRWLENPARAIYGEQRGTNPLGAQVIDLFRFTARIR